MFLYCSVSCSRVSRCRTHNTPSSVLRKPPEKLRLRTIDDPALLQRLRTASRTLTNTCGIDPRHHTIPSVHRNLADVFPLFLHNYLGLQEVPIPFLFDKTPLRPTRAVLPALTLCIGTPLHTQPHSNTHTVADSLNCSFEGLIVDR